MSGEEEMMEMQMPKDGKFGLASRAPIVGDWFIRNNKGHASRRAGTTPTDYIRVAEVDEARDEIWIQRLDGWKGNRPVFGRKTSVRFSTLRHDRRYHVCGMAPTPQSPMPPPLPRTPPASATPLTADDGGGPTLATVFAETRAIRLLLEQFLGGQLALPLVKK